MKYAKSILYVVRVWEHIRWVWAAQHHSVVVLHCDKVSGDFDGRSNLSLAEWRSVKTKVGLWSSYGVCVLLSLWCCTAIKVIAGCVGYSIPSWDECCSMRVKREFSATIKLIAPDRLLSGESDTIPTACTVESKTMAVVQVSAPPLTQRLCSRLCQP